MHEKNYDLLTIGASCGGLGVALGMLEWEYHILLFDKRADPEKPCS